LPDKYPVPSGTDFLMYSRSSCSIWEVVFVEARTRAVRPLYLLDWYVMNEGGVKRRKYWRADTKKKEIQEKK